MDVVNGVESTWRRAATHLDYYHIWCAVLARRLNHGHSLLGRNRRHCRRSSWPSYTPSQSYGRGRSMGQRWLQIQNGQEGGSGDPWSQVHIISVLVVIVSSQLIDFFATGMA
jgi:hypothetical protein